MAVIGARGSGAAGGAEAGVGTLATAVDAAGVAVRRVESGRGSAGVDPLMPTGSAFPVLVAKTDWRAHAAIRSTANAARMRRWGEDPIITSSSGSSRMR